MSGADAQIARQQMVENLMGDDEVLCAFCAKAASKKCGRCGEFYCSLECQLGDWRNHRFICFPLPQLLPLHSNGRSGFLTRSPSMTSVSSRVGRVRTTPEKITSTTPKYAPDGGNDSDTTIIETRESTEIVEAVAVDVRNNQSELICEIENAAASLEPSSTTNEHDDSVDKGSCGESAKEVATDPKAVLLSPGSTVIIVSVIDHQTVRVRVNADNYQQLVDSVIKGAIDAPRLTSRPTIGDIVLALSKENAMYGRACVEEINGRSATVQFLEFGGSEIAEASHIKVIPNSLRRETCLLNDIKLVGVPSSAVKSEEIVDYLSRLCRNCTPLQLKYATDQTIDSSSWRIRIEGELVDITTTMSINQKAIELNVATPLIHVVNEPLLLISTSVSEVSASANEMLYKGFSGENVTVLILDNSFLHSGYLSCIREADANLFGKNDANVNAYGERVANGSPFLPSEFGMLCVARSTDDKRWYRAMFLKKSDKNACAVLYIDYGNKETVKLSEIRPMTEELLFDCITVSCFIKDATSNDKKVPKALETRLRELYPSYEKTTFDAVEYLTEGEAAIVTHKQTVDKLRNEKLI